MPNVYCRLPDLQNDGNSSASGNAAGLLRAAIAASAEVEDRTLRNYSARLVTAYLDVPAPNRANNMGQRLWLPFDVASITTLKLKTGDPLTFGTTLTENTDFLAYREEGDSNKPMLYLDVLGGSASLGNWPEGTQILQLVGYRGYSYETVDSGLTGTLASTSTTTLTPSADASSTIYAGDMLRIEDEQVYVTAVTGGSPGSITVERAQNGTVAAAHSGKALLIRRYPPEISEATKIRALDLFQGKRTGFQGSQGGEDVGFGSTLGYKQFVGLLGPMRRLAVP